jgi:hypothetical protein
VRLSHEDGQSQQVSLVPDAFYTLTLPSGKKTLHCALEIDRATSTLEANQWHAKSWRRKVLAYKVALESGIAQTAWGANSFIITTCCNSRNRLVHMQEVAERAGADHHFWFAVWPDVAAANGGLLAQPIWQVAGNGDKRYALLLNHEGGAGDPAAA